MSKLETLCRERGIVAVCRYGKNKRPANWDRWNPPHGWSVTLSYKPKPGTRARTLTVDFFQGSAHTKPPSAADVLSCLISDADVGSRSFEEFCSDLGYDTDSRKAHEAWEQCHKMAPRVRRFLGVDFDLFAGKEH